MKNALELTENGQNVLPWCISGIAERVVFAGLVISCIAAASYPEPLSSGNEIRAAKPTLESIDIWSLPLEDYPLLSKFSALQRIRLYSREGTFATDEKLKSLADIGFTNLSYIDLNNCKLVTDKGIEALSKIQPLKQLQLEGTAITDATCFRMASNMTLKVVNVANCNGLTKAGPSALAKSESLQELRFSIGSMTQDEVLVLIESFKSVAWCEIVDPTRKLDAEAIKKKAAERKIQVNVRPTGALQDMRLK